MPKPRPEDQKCAAIGAGAKATRAATGDGDVDFPADDGNDKAAQSLGRRGGRARAKALSAKQRSEIASKAAKKRWSRL